MTDVVLFHHALGLTPGMTLFAEELQRAGHVVHLPDLFEGRTFDAFEDGLAHAEEIGFREIVNRGAAAVAALPAELVYAGFSLGVLPAQALAQTRAGARGALLIYSCVPPDALAPGWPAGLPVQVHAKEDDRIFVEEGDLAAAQAIVASTPEAALFLYPGSEHYFADPTLPTYDADATALLLQRVRAFLDGLPAARPRRGLFRRG